MERADADTELVAPLVDCPLQKGSVGAETDVNRGDHVRTQEKPLPTAEERAWHGPSVTVLWRHQPAGALGADFSLQAGRQRGLSCASVLCHGSRSSQLTQLEPDRLLNRRGKKKS